MRAALVYFGSCLHHQWWREKGKRNGSKTNGSTKEGGWFQLPKENPAVPVMEMWCVPGFWSGLCMLALNMERCFWNNWVGRSSGPVFLFLFFKKQVYPFFYFNKFILFIYFWLHWVFVAMCSLSLVVVSGGYSSLRCAGFSLRWRLLLWSTGSRHVGFSSCGAQLRWLSCSAACGIFPDQGSNPCPLHWQADS